MTEKSVFRASRILTKQATHGPESKLLETSDREKTQIASYGRAFNCVDVICPAKKSHYSSALGLHSLFCRM